MGDAATGVWLLIGSVSGYMGLLQSGSPRRWDSSRRHTSPAATTRPSAAPSRRRWPWCSDSAGGPAGHPGRALVDRARSRFPAALTARRPLAFVLGIVGVPLQMPGHAFNAVLGASQRQDRSTHVWMVSLTGKLVGIGVLLTLGYGLAAVMWLETVMIIVADVLLAVYAFSVAPQLRVGAVLVSAETARSSSASADGCSRRSHVADRADRSHRHRRVPVGGRGHPLLRGVEAVHVGLQRLHDAGPGRRADRRRPVRRRRSPACSGCGGG